MLHLKTFGGLSVDIDGIPATGAAQRRKTLALLALLAGNSHRGISRDKLIACLWPETDVKHGRDLLKQACYGLRRDLHTRELFLGLIELRLNPGVISSDLEQFEFALAQKDLERAILLYSGPFLDGFHGSGAPEFEAWAEIQRGHFAARAQDALQSLATTAAAQGDHSAAAKWWRQAAELDPLSGCAARGLMTELAARGEVAEAVRHGRAYQALIQAELGTPPEGPIDALLGRLHLEPASGEGITAQDLGIIARAAGGRRTVGYQRERETLRSALDAALTGRGLIVCIAGEAGSGKTTLAEDFLGEILASGRPCHIARGGCSERLAGSGAYLPLLDALEGLLRADRRGLVLHLMHQLAPSWHAQVAPLLGGGGTGAPSEPQAASQERLKRELFAFFSEASRLRPLVLFLDDVHWSDASTVDLLGYVATRMGMAHILIVATYRPADLLLSGHPFRALALEWQTLGLGHELILRLLQREDVGQLLTLEFPGHRFPSTFAEFLHDKTEGSPLFLLDLLRYLRSKQVIRGENGGWDLDRSVSDLALELPESVRSMIERKIEQLGEADRGLLAAAGVQGYEFDSPVVASALKKSVTEVEEQLDKLGRVQAFVHRLRDDRLPDGTPTVRYRFTHVLYQNALELRLTPTHKATLSAATAQALQDHYGDQRTEIAAELALLFEAARDGRRAIEYYLLAAQEAHQLYAYHEAALLARRGLELLKTIPASPERCRRELLLQTTLGHCLATTKGYAAPESGAAMSRARELCGQLDEPTQLFPATFGLWSYYLVAAELQSAREMAEQLVRVAEDAGDAVLLFGAHTALGSSLHHVGEHGSGLEHLQRGFALYDPGRRRLYKSLYSQDAGVYCLCEMMRTLWLLGYPEQSVNRLQDTLVLARAASDPQASAFALTYAAIVYQFRREALRAEEHAQACIALSREHGLVTHAAWTMIVRGWAVAEQGALAQGIAQMREGVAAQRAMGLSIEFPYFLSLLAETLGRNGDIEEGLAVVAEALAIAGKTGQPIYEGELYRLRGELSSLRGDRPDQVELCFRQALALAQRQSAKSLELRAATSLGRLCQREGRRSEARAVLEDLYAWFTEGFDTPDLSDARVLLGELSPDSSAFNVMAQTG
jgi:predicted ATPase/DNA-binding SARP family transcriptional activator